MNIEKLTHKTVAKLFDHTNLQAYAQEKDFQKLCQEAKDYGFASVMVNSSAVEICSHLLRDTDVAVGSVVGFPLGQMSITAKCAEAEDAIRCGANEIDYVLNIGRLKDNDIAYLTEEMSALTAICLEHRAIIKVIFENCYLTRKEIIAAAEIAKKVRPDFIKTSTGFGTSGATAEDVNLMKKIVGDEVKVKAAGGIRTWADCRAMLEAGAERIGASAGVKILAEFDDWLKNRE